MQEISVRDLRRVTIYVGAHSARWRDFGFAMQRCWHYLSGRSLVPPDDHTRLSSSSPWRKQHLATLIARHFRSSEVQTHSFPSISFLLDLIDLGRRQCFNPLDRVFAVRRILGLHDIDMLKPDYQLRSAQIYARVMTVATQCMRGQ